MKAREAFDSNLPRCDGMLGGWQRSYAQMIFRMW
jgi:hypothetical protein